MKTIIKKRIKTNIRQAKTRYKLRQIVVFFKILFKGQITKKSLRHWKKVLLGLPKYQLDKCIN